MLRISDTGARDSFFHEDPVEGIEDTYSELAKNAEMDENHFTAVRNALRRLTNLQDATGKIYFYDSVEVLSVQDYMNKLKLMAWMRLIMSHGETRFRFQTSAFGTEISSNDR